jgi:hypothetical protein
MAKYFRWEPGKSPSQTWRIQAYVDAIVRNIHLIMLSFAPRIEADAKGNATWTDRTGNARQTLSAFVYSPEDKVIVLVLKQVMEYGVYLETLKRNQPQRLANPELGQAGKYAIILPTLEGYYGPVWNRVKGLLR